MLRNHLLAALLLGVCGHSVAAQQSLNAPHPRFRPFVVLTAGADFTSTGQSQYLTLNPPLSNYYASNPAYPGGGSAGIGGGVEGHSCDLLFWQLGVSGFYNTKVTSSGDIWQYGYSDFDNVSYRYQIQSSRIVATGKLLSTVKQIVHPYLSGELGAAFNRSSGYKETPLVAGAITMAPFDHYTQTSFSWGVGAGIDIDVNAHLRLGLGYHFMDLGKASLGLSPAQVTNARLKISNLYDNQARFQLTALI